MSFISLTFIIFLIIIIPLYYVIPQKYRWIFLLINSYIFYSFSNIKYFIYLFFVTLSTFYIALYIDKLSNNNSNKKLFYVTLALVLNFGIIAFFKIFNFIADNSVCYSNLNNSINFIVLPLGLSFYTFQALGYVIDVYRGQIKAETNVAKYALFISFFPQFIMGPISRFSDLTYQFFQKYDFNRDRFVYGISRIVLGFFKKLVIADRLAIFIEQICSNYTDYSGFILLLALIALTFQIYADFSSYMDIAVGIANCFGIDIQENFKTPLFSKSLKDLWTRWHITLGTWFRDYVYFSLGGSRVKKFRHFFNILFVWFLVGLWHGISLNFIIFGLINGILIIVGIYVGNYIKVIFSDNIIKSKTFSFFCGISVIIIFSLTSVFPRMSNALDGFNILKKIFFKFLSNDTFYGLTSNLFSTKEWILALIGILLVFVVDYLNFTDKIKTIKIWYRIIFISILLIFILYFGQFGMATFVYLQY